MAGSGLDELPWYLILPVALVLIALVGYVLYCAYQMDKRNRK